MPSTTKSRKHQARKYVRMIMRQLRNDAKAGKATDIAALVSSDTYGYGSIDKFCGWLAARDEIMMNDPSKFDPDLVKYTHFLLGLVKEKFEATNPEWFVVATSSASGDTVFDELNAEAGDDIESLGIKLA